MSKELELGTYIHCVINATQENNHCHALKLVAMYVRQKHNRLEGVDKLEKNMDAVIQLHSFYGHMPEHLIQVRNDIKNAIFSFLNDKETLMFSNAL